MADPLRLVSTPTPPHFLEGDDFDPDALLNECLADLDEVSFGFDAAFAAELEALPPPPLNQELSRFCAPKLEDPCDTTALKRALSDFEEFKAVFKSRVLFDKFVMRTKGILSDNRWIEQQIPAEKAPKMIEGIYVMGCQHPNLLFHSLRAFFGLESERFYIMPKNVFVSSFDFLEMLIESSMPIEGSESGLGPKFRTTSYGLSRRLLSSEEILFVGGILNDTSDVLKNSETLEKKASREVVPFWNNTWPKDFKEKKAYEMVSKELAGLIFQKISRNERLCIIAHSHGASTTLGALKTLRTDENPLFYKNIEVYAFGGVTAIPKLYAQKVGNYRNYDDLVYPLGEMLWKEKLKSEISWKVTAGKGTGHDFVEGYSDAAVEKIIRFKSRNS